MKNLRNQLGATLLELVMSIGIIAVIAISALAFFQQANEQNKITAEVSSVGALVAGIRNMYITQGDYNGLTNTIIIRSNIFPDRMRNPGAVGAALNQIKTSWGTNGIVLTAEAVDGVADGGFVMQYNTVPRGACVDFVSKVLGNFTLVEVNDNEVTNVASIVNRCTEAEANIIKFHTR